MSDEQKNDAVTTPAKNLQGQGILNAMDVTRGGLRARVRALFSVEAARIEQMMCQRGNGPLEMRREELVAAERLIEMINSN